MKTRIHELLLNDLHGVNVVKCDEFEDSYILTHHTDDYPFCTIYHGNLRHYTVYQVVNDVWLGIAIDDEKKIGEKLTPQQAVNAAKKLQKLIYSPKKTGKSSDYPTILSTADGKNLQVEHHNQHGDTQ